MALPVVAKHTCLATNPQSAALWLDPESANDTPSSWLAQLRALGYEAWQLVSGVFTVTEAHA